CRQPVADHTSLPRGEARLPSAVGPRRSDTRNDCPRAGVDEEVAGGRNSKEPMGGEHILETQALTKEFKGFVAVREVNLKVRRGSIHALIGPNGAGKTTVFNLLTKFLAPTRGRILHAGEDITRMKPADVARRGIVRSFQISAVFP